MATRYDSRTNGCIFQWKIENLSHCCWLEKGVELVSPTFILDEFSGAIWSLHLYPMGGAKFENSIGFYLHREDDSGPHEMEVNYHLAFLSKDGRVLKELYEDTYLKSGEGLGRQNFESQKRVFFTQRKEFLSEDALTVQCTIRDICGEICGTFANLKHLYARTIFKVNRRSVLWKIDKFSTVKPVLRNKFKDNLIDLDLILDKDIFNMDVISYDDSIKYISVNISIIDSEGRKTNCGVGEFNGSKIQWSSFGGMHVEYGKFRSTSYYISRIPVKLMKHKSQYMPNDVLSLYVEYVFSTVTNSYEYFGSGTISPKLTKEVVENGIEHHVGKETSQNASVLIDDLKSMYTDGIFSDTTLHTSSQTFPVHRGILSARSPVFSRMFSHDMKEKNSGHVHITDLENDTVHRMLLFIYTDFLEDLQFESASKLYVAADKYEILSLKSRCSSFLKDNICPTKACDVLILADLHQDEDLKSFVQGYILEHNDVFSLQEWKHLMENNLKLAAAIMYRKIHPCNE
ncbi:Speckle-type POZ protein [Araneus ventricosus]|uniref:Speckle-type POZ protein n=1 Tax=Araneus ventricosus TaxID=182803 RepID=A0A4Y2SZD9_ARAVE|nr:Speckle-type POZ protein [Araneus ventricosus]